MTGTTVYRDRQVNTLLLGCRVRYVVRGEPHYGTIVQLTNSYAAEAIVLREDGSMFEIRVVRLQVAEEQLPLTDPYRAPA